MPGPLLSFLITCLCCTRIVLRKGERVRVCACCNYCKNGGNPAEEEVEEEAAEVVVVVAEKDHGKPCGDDIEIREDSNMQVEVLDNQNIRIEIEEEEIGFPAQSSIEKGSNNYQIS